MYCTVHMSYVELKTSTLLRNVSSVTELYYCDHKWQFFTVLNVQNNWQMTTDKWWGNLAYRKWLRGRRNWASRNSSSWIRRPASYWRVRSRRSWCSSSDPTTSSLVSGLWKVEGRDTRKTNHSSHTVYRSKSLTKTAKHGITCTQTCPQSHWERRILKYYRN